MVTEKRSDPDLLLTHVQAEENQQNRGRLKIFLGYAAGVGKTYAMLEAAHQRLAERVDVVVGYVETHDRLETKALLEGLEVIPRLSIMYRGVQLTEMDIDAILKRKPQLALVDELAHTNAPGSRHTKRYQDVEELLTAGIDIYTTLNIQHLESLNDVVAQITGTKVRETVPDRIVDEVTDIELIDLPPQELLTRLKEGKVYVPDQAQTAITKFFRTGNLTALRELTMRRAAERVDDQMVAYMQTLAIPGPWSASERILVCISPGSMGERLVRTARRLADELNAEWYAVYVEAPGTQGNSIEQRERVNQTLRLAEQLGAKPISMPGQSVAETVIDYAHSHNITKIIVGKPVRTRWEEFLHRSVVDQLIRHSGQIDVYVVSSEAETFVKKAVETWRPHSSAVKYLTGAALAIAATGLGALIAPYISPINLVIIYLMAVVLAAVYLGRGPAVLASFLSVAAFDFFFVPPRFTMAVSDTEYILTFFGLLAVGLVISQLTARANEQAQAAKAREVQTITLYELSRDLALATKLESVTQTIISHIEQTFKREAAIFLPESSKLELYTASPGLEIAQNDMAVAVWSFEHGKTAGRGTDTLPDSAMRYLPFNTPRGVVGVLGVKPVDQTSNLSLAQRRTLDVFTNQGALAIERARLLEKARQDELLEVTEKLQSALLNSISHDLRTPLVTITGALSSLAEEAPALDTGTQRSLIQSAREEADRLNRLVGNLLDMTRLESGTVHIRREFCDVQDVIGAALAEFEPLLVDRPVIINLAPDLPLVPMDFVLIERVLVNLVDNAIKYSPPGSSIEINAHPSGAFLEIEVADEGIGIPPEDLGRVFTKFYRVQRPEQVSGTGLGLSISKGIVEAHGGFIGAENRKEGGVLITIALPQA